MTLIMNARTSAEYQLRNAREIIINKLWLTASVQMAREVISHPTPFFVAAFPTLTPLSFTLVSPQRELLSGLMDFYGKLWVQVIISPHV